MFWDTESEKNKVAVQVCKHMTKKKKDTTSSWEKNSSIQDQNGQIYDKKYKKGQIKEEKTKLTRQENMIKLIIIIIKKRPVAPKSQIHNEKLITS